MRSLRPPPRWTAALCALAALALTAGPPAVAQPAAPAPAAVSQATESPPLRVVGGLASLSQYTRHEQPFWSRRLAELSGGRWRAEIVPFDRAGIRGNELLSMVRLGTVPFGTLLLSQVAPRDAELAGADLAGASPDVATLRQVVAAWRPHLAALLRERHGAELLAVYAYPAQVLFCQRPLSSLASLRGLRVRTSGLTQADFVEALGARPVGIPFGELVANVRSGNVDCAITGTMSGYTIGLHRHATHLHTMPVTWGLSMFVAHGASWRALDPGLRSLLERELPTLEAAIWDEAERETAQGVACSTGSAPCPGGDAGRMQRVDPAPGDDAIRRRILANTVLPRWIERCGTECAASWNALMAPVLGVRGSGG